MARGAAGSIGVTLTWWERATVVMGIDEGEHFLHYRDTSVAITPRTIRLRTGTRRIDSGLPASDTRNWRRHGASGGAPPASRSSGDKRLNSPFILMFFAFCAGSSPIN